MLRLHVTEWAWVTWPGLARTLVQRLDGLRAVVPRVDVENGTEALIVDRKQPRGFGRDFMERTSASARTPPTV